MPLVNRPAPKTLPMRMPTLRVRHRDPSHHFGKLSIVSRPQNKVPVVGHETVRGDTDGGPLVSFAQNLFKERPGWGSGLWILKFSLHPSQGLGL